MKLTFDYQSCLEASDRVAWSIDAVLGPAPRLDFNKPFLPDALVREVSNLTFLSSRDRLRLNQITSYSYLNLFQLVEKYIIEGVMAHAALESGGQLRRTALLRFSEEEAKHRRLFKRCLQLFKPEFGETVRVLEIPQEMGRFVFSKRLMALTLITLHVELITQQHYVEFIRQDRQTGSLDPLFRTVLKHHWLEEAQHARIDQLELARLVQELQEGEIEEAVQDYFDLCRAFDLFLSYQAQWDVDSLSHATGRRFEAHEAGGIAKAQHEIYRRMFILMGFAHSTFRSLMGEISAPGLQGLCAESLNHHPASLA